MVAAVVGGGGEEAEIAGRGGEGGVHRVVLEGEEGVEERDAGREAAGGVQGGGGEVGVVAHGGLAVLECGEPGGGGRSAGGDGDAHRQHVDERADDGIGAGEVGVAVGGGGAEEDVGGRGVVGEGEGEGALDEGVEGQAVAAGAGSWAASQAR